MNMGLPICITIDPSKQRLRFLREKFVPQFAFLQFETLEDFFLSPEIKSPCLLIVDSKILRPDSDRILRDLSLKAPFALRSLLFDKSSLHTVRSFPSAAFDSAILWSDSVEWIERQLEEFIQLFHLKTHLLQLEQLTTTDFLTGLRNKKYFQERLTNELELANRGKRSLSLILIDADHFKRVNDAHGHSHGDAMLCKIANTLRSELRNSDLLARLGGDEFSVILPDTDLKGAELVAERLRLGIFEDRECASLPLTLSLGVASFPERAKSLDQLFRMGDSALLKAKKLGRNQVVTESESD